MATRSGTPLWATLGCGCVLLAVLVIGAIVAAGFFGVSAFKTYVDDMRDPAARAAKASEILGAEQLPAGYTAHLFLHIPWLLDMVMLSDSEPAVIEGDDFELASDAIGQHLLVYLSLPDSGMDHGELEDMLRGKKSHDGVRTDINLELESEEELSRGSFTLGDQELSYIGHRGELDLHDGDLEGIYSQVLIDCPGDDLTRAAVWFQRAAGSSGSGANGADDPGQNSVIGTPADESELRRFMDHFSVCG